MIPLSLILTLCFSKTVYSHFYDVPVINEFFPEFNHTVLNEATGYAYNPLGPLLPCSHLPLHSIKCEPPLDLKGNESLFRTLRKGCLKWGGRYSTEVQLTSISCYALRGIECYGARKFDIDGYPCLRYTDHYFLTALLYSLLLGFLGVDRFYLGHIGTGVGKVLTLGGMGVWWLVDIVLLIKGELKPADDSSWMPFL